MPETLSARMPNLEGGQAPASNDQGNNAQPAKQFAEIGKLSSLASH
jgi:hypothetical protein